MRFESWQKCVLWVVEGNSFASSKLKSGEPVTKFPYLLLLGKGVSPESRQGWGWCGDSHCPPFSLEIAIPLFCGVCYFYILQPEMEISRHKPPRSQWINSQNFHISKIITSGGGRSWSWKVGASWLAWVQGWECPVPMHVDGYRRGFYMVPSTISLET